MPPVLGPNPQIMGGAETASSLLARRLSSAPTITTARVAGVVRLLESG